MIDSKKVPNGTQRKHVPILRPVKHMHGLLLQGSALYLLQRKS